MNDEEHIEFMSKDLAPIDRVNYMNDRIEEKRKSERKRILGIIEKRIEKCEDYKKRIHGERAIEQEESVDSEIELWEELKKEVEKDV